MVSSASSVPWNETPSRPFPALVWVKGQYRFRVSSAMFARLGTYPLEAAARRPFPALLWVRGQHWINLTGG